MTPNEYAKKLVKQFRLTMTGPGIEANNENAPVAARLHCDKIIELLETLNKPEYAAFSATQLFTIETPEYSTHLHGYELLEYFKAVKKETTKL